MQHVLRKGRVDVVLNGHVTGGLPLQLGRCRRRRRRRRCRRRVIKVWLAARLRRADRTGQIGRDSFEATPRGEPRSERTFVRLNPRRPFGRLRPRLRRLPRPRRLRRASLERSNPPQPLLPRGMQSLASSIGVLELRGSRVPLTRVARRERRQL